MARNITITEEDLLSVGYAGAPVIVAPGDSVNLGQNVYTVAEPAADDWNLKVVATGLKIYVTPNPAGGGFNASAFAIFPGGLSAQGSFGATGSTRMVGT